MDTKTRLLNTSTALFALRGYDAVGVKEIVDKAGVTKPTLYHHFGNKEGLLKAVLMQLDDFLLVSRHQSAYNGDLYLSLKASLLSYISFAKANKSLFSLFRFMTQMPHATLSAQLVQPYQRQSLAILEAMFSAASLDHGNMQGRSSVLSINFMSMCLTYATLVVEADFNMNDEMTHQVLHTFSHGIYS